MSEIDDLAARLDRYAAIQSDPMSATDQFHICGGCGFETTFQHDHKPDNTGLDDGPDMHPTRKKATPKPPDVAAAVRSRAWATRREKYGARGHG